MEVALTAFRKRFTYDSAKDLLGKGGFGEVYKAYDNEDKIFVALKISQGVADSKYNLINEIKRFKQLNHPNIVKHIESYEVNTGSLDIHGNPIVYHVGILEYADKGTVADLLKKGIPDYRLVEDLAKDIINGLAYLHSQNIIHRDLKPTNILLFSNGETLRAKITDFGIAKRSDATAASTQLVGTVEYMAPEFFTTGIVTPASDMWSLGVMLLEALTGVHPFGKTTQELSNEQIINNILNKNLSNATQNLQAPLKQIITKCLLREPNLRPQTAGEIKGELTNTTSDQFTERTQIITKPKLSPKNLVQWKAIYKKAAFGLAVLFLVIISVFFLIKYNRERRILVPTYSSTGYYGFKDAKTGEVVIPLKYDYADSFYDGRAKVLIDGKFGYLNKRGEVVISPIYDDAQRFSEGMAAIGKRIDEDIEWGYIGKDGKELIIPQYDEAHEFEYGLAQVSLGFGKDGVINKNGMEIIPLQYMSSTILEKFIKVGSCPNQSCQEAIYSHDGKEIIPFKYEFISQFKNGLALVKLLDKKAENSGQDIFKYGWINEKGTVEIPIKYDEAEDFVDGLAPVKLDGKYSFINGKGETAIATKYDFAECFSDGLALVGNKTSDTSAYVGYIDKTGKEVIPLKYEDAQNFDKGIAPAKLNGKWGYINKLGYNITEFKYTKTYTLLPAGTTSGGYDRHNHLNVSINGKDGVLDKAGKELFPCIYDELDGPDEYGRILAKKDGFYGVIDTLGNTIIPFHYEQKVGLIGRHGLYNLGQNGSYGVLDYNGAIVVNFINNGYQEIRDDQIIQSGLLYNNKIEPVFWFNRTGRVVREFK